MIKYIQIKHSCTDVEEKAFIFRCVEVPLSQTDCEPMSLSCEQINFATCELF